MFYFVRIIQYNVNMFFHFLHHVLQTAAALLFFFHTHGNVSLGGFLSPVAYLWWFCVVDVLMSGKHLNANGGSESQGRLMLDWFQTGCKWEGKLTSKIEVITLHLAGTHFWLKVWGNLTIHCLFLQLTARLEATPNWLWKICSNLSSKSMTRKPNGSMVSNPQYWLYVLEFRASLLIALAMVWNERGTEMDEIYINIQYEGIIWMGSKETWFFSHDR